jgi:hypothetical protein
MVILIASAMVGTAKVMQPYIEDLTSMNGVERYRSLAEYLLLSSGNPSDWGKNGDVIPSTFGLASETWRPYELDLDKVTRLNTDNLYSLPYREILAALGTEDISFNIRIRPLFEVAIELTSSQMGETETIYTFKVSTSKSGYPLATWLKGYIVIGAYVDGVSSSTNSNGVGIMNATLSNVLGGTALLVVFAKSQAHPQMISFNAYSFGHNSEASELNQTFLRLSPLNYVLNASFRNSTVQVSNAYVFTYSHNSSLSQTTVGNESIEYGIPRLLEASPMLLVLNGNNASASFAEWAAYPQLPLEIGADFSDLTSKSKAVAVTYVVSVNSVLYEAVITSRSVQNFDA